MKSGAGPIGHGEIPGREGAGIVHLKHMIRIETVDVFPDRIALGIHLFHGAWSMFQSMGINSPRYNGARRAIAAGVAGAITIVNVSFPLAVLFGIVG